MLNNTKNLSELKRLTAEQERQRLQASKDITRLTDELFTAHSKQNNALLNLRNLNYQIKRLEHGYIRRLVIKIKKLIMEIF